MPDVTFKVLWLAAGVAVLSALLPAFANAEEKAAPRVPSVTVAPVETGEVVGRVSVSGTLVPREEILIYPQVNGYNIEALSVDIGDSVHKGDILAVLNDRTLKAEVARAQAELARAGASVRQAESQIASAQASKTQAETALERSEKLRTSGTVTQASLDDAIASSQTAVAALASAKDGLAVAEAQVQQAEAQLQIARINLDHATLTSPADGVITARNGQIGAIAGSGGEPIFRLIRDGTVEVEVEVIETALGRISLGDTAALGIASVGEVTGSVRRISPTVDPVNRLGTIRIATDAEEGLKPGLSAGGWVITDRRVSLTVPTTAVLTDATGTYVLGVEDKIIERRDVVAGLIWEDRREIISGLSEGDTVVAKAGAFFSDGDTVNPIFPSDDLAAGAAE